MVDLWFKTTYFWRDCRWHAFITYEEIVEVMVAGGVRVW